MGRALKGCRPIPFALLLLLAAATAFAQEAASEKLSPKVKVGSGDGVPGAMVTLPLSLESARTTDIAEIVSRIVFPPQVMFLRFEPAPSLKVAGIAATIKNVEPPAGETPPPDDKRRATEIRITRTREAGALQDGTLGQLIFTIDAEAMSSGDEELDLSYDITIDAFGKGETRVSAGAYSDGAKILLASATVPITACFFYMH